MLLEVRNLQVAYGPIHVLRDISISVPEKSIVSLIGSNGAGKTTTLLSISGIKSILGGEIWFEGQRIDNLSPAAIVRLGVSHVPEGRRVFKTLTVRENLEMGAYTTKNLKSLKETLDWVFQLFPRLKERERQFAGTMSGGEQQMLAIGRALMAQPKLLLMDEPSLGLAPRLVKLVFDIIKDINAAGVSVLLVEQNAVKALNVSSYAYILEMGQIALEGPSDVLKNDQRVRLAYLGG